MCKARHREAASDFNAALAEYRRYLQRAAEAAGMRAAAEAAGPPTEGPAGGGPSDQGSFRLKPGETLRLPAVKVHGRPLPTFCMSGTMRVLTPEELAFAWRCQSAHAVACKWLQARYARQRAGSLQATYASPQKDCDMPAPDSTVFGPGTDSSAVTAVQPRLSAPGLSLSSLATAVASAAPVLPPGGCGPPVLAPPPRAGAGHPCAAGGVLRRVIK